jgi:hypothetical protein
MVLPSLQEEQAAPVTPLVIQVVEVEELVEPQSAKQVELVLPLLLVQVAAAEVELVAALLQLVKSVKLQQVVQEATDQQVLVVVLPAMPVMVELALPQQVVAEVEVTMSLVVA